ncbi:MAG: hypothetical protein ACJ76Y_28350 [Thermoanaerobaculia bacterium]
MRKQRIMLDEALVISWQGSTLRPASLPAIPEIEFMPSGLGITLRIKAALTVSEVNQILEIFPLSERSGRWRAFWQRQYQCWLKLPPQGLSAWLTQALLHREMYPLLYIVPPLTPSVECMTLLERIPPESAQLRDTAVTISLERAIDSRDWKLINNLLPMIGRLRIESCLTALVDLINNLPVIQSQQVDGENIYRNIFRCLASFEKTELIPLFKKSLAVKLVADVCFTALLSSDNNLDMSDLNDIVNHFATNPDYVAELLRRFLAETNGPLAEIQALRALRRISQDSSDVLAERLDPLIDKGLERSSHSSRMPTRNEIKAASSWGMRDLEESLVSI